MLILAENFLILQLTVSSPGTVHQADVQLEHCLFSSKIDQRIIRMMNKQSFVYKPYCVNYWCREVIHNCPSRQFDWCFSNSRSLPLHGHFSTMPW